MRDTDGKSPSILPGVAGTLFQYLREAAWLILESVEAMANGWYSIGMEGESQPRRMDIETRDHTQDEVSLKPK